MGLMGQEQVYLSGERVGDVFIIEVTFIALRKLIELDDRDEI